MLDVRQFVACSAKATPLVLLTALIALTAGNTQLCSQIADSNQQTGSEECLIPTGIVTEGVVKASSGIIEVGGQAEILASGSAVVIARGQASVEASGNSKVIAYDQVKVELYDKAQLQDRRGKSHTSEGKVFIHTMTVNESRMHRQVAYDLNSPVARVYQSNRDKVVEIKGPFKDRPNKLSVGTGFFVSADGTIATCYHVIAPCTADQITITTSRGAEYSVRIKAIAPEFDLALLKIESKSKANLNFPSVDVSNADSMPNEGTPAVVMGFPQGQDLLNVSPGRTEAAITISELPTYHAPEWENTKNKLITIESHIESGNSGGPVFNARTGQLIGVVSKGRRYFVCQHMIRAYAMQAQELLTLLNKTGNKA